jgi:hypothetical protein
MLGDTDVRSIEAWRGSWSRKYSSTAFAFCGSVSAR